MSSTMMIRKSDEMRIAVETALTGKMTAKGTRRIAKSRSSRNEGSCFSAAEKPSIAYRTDAKKLRRFRRFGSSCLSIAIEVTTDVVSVGSARVSDEGSGLLGGILAAVEIEIGEIVEDICVTSILFINL